MSRDPDQWRNEVAVAHSMKTRCYDMIDEAHGVTSIGMWPEAAELWEEAAEKLQEAAILFTRALGYSFRDHDWRPADDGGSQPLQRDDNPPSSTSGGEVHLRA